MKRTIFILAVVTTVLAGCTPSRHIQSEPNT